MNCPMVYTYKHHKPLRRQESAPLDQEAALVPNLAALMNGTVRPTAAQKGRSIDLDGAIKAKMEHAFGDLSSLKLYESRAVGDAGAEAIAQGNEIAFAPVMTDFSTRAGQERLGHELSHVMSQRSGRVRGEGFLANTALEGQADREGAVAAAGEQVYTDPVTRALSDASPSPAASGPMQAKRSWFGGKKKKTPVRSITNDDEDMLRPSYADDFDLLSTQKGSPEERKNAYDHMAVNTMNNLTDPQKKSLDSYISGSEPINAYLRDDRGHLEYPKGKELQRVQQEIETSAPASKTIRCRKTSRPLRVSPTNILS